MTINDAKAFLLELDILCRTHRIAIEHENPIGAFLLVSDGDYTVIQDAVCEDA